MAVRLRLMRMGKKKQPTYRVVAADSRSPRDGRFIEIIGTYQPRLEPSGIKIQTDRAVHWLKVGAKPSEAVEKILKISGAWDVFTGDAPMPEPEVAAEAEPEAAASAPADAGDADSADADSADAGEAAADEAEQAGAEA